MPDIPIRGSIDTLRRFGAGAQSKFVKPGRLGSRKVNRFFKPNSLITSLCNKLRSPLKQFISGSLKKDSIQSKPMSKHLVRQLSESSLTDSKKKLHASMKLVRQISESSLIDSKKWKELSSSLENVAILVKDGSRIGLEKIRGVRLPVETVEIAIDTKRHLSQKDYDKDSLKKTKKQLKTVTNHMKTLSPSERKELQRLLKNDPEIKLWASRLTAVIDKVDKKQATEITKLYDLATGRSLYDETIGSTAEPGDENINFDVNVKVNPQKESSNTGTIYHPDSKNTQLQEIQEDAAKQRVRQEEMERASDEEYLDDSIGNETISHPDSKNTRLKNVQDNLANERLRQEKMGRASDEEYLEGTEDELKKLSIFNDEKDLPKSKKEQDIRDKEIDDQFGLGKSADEKDKEIDNLFGIGGSAESSDVSQKTDRE